MTRSASPRLQTYTALAAIALVTALAAGRPELAALATPFMLLVAVVLAGSVPLALDGTLRLDRQRAVEEEHVRATVTVVNGGAPARVELHLPTTRPRSLSGSPAASSVRSRSNWRSAAGASTAPGPRWSARATG